MKHDVVTPHPTDAQVEAFQDAAYRAVYPLASDHDRVDNASRDERFDRQAAYAAVTHGAEIGTGTDRDIAPALRAHMAKFGTFYGAAEHEGLQRAVRNWYLDTPDNVDAVESGPGPSGGDVVDAKDEAKATRTLVSVKLKVAGAIAGGDTSPLAFQLALILGIDLPAKGADAGAGTVTTSTDTDETQPGGGGGRPSGIPD